MRYIKIVLILFLAGISAGAAKNLLLDKAMAQGDTKTVKFREIWGYLMRGEERFVTGNEPFTDIAYFSSEIGETGRLEKPSQPPKLPAGANGPRRFHLVISTPWNKALMYFCLRKDLPVRNQLLDDIVQFSENFDGVQLDFEALRDEDGPAYLDFLRELKKRLPSKTMLSIAVPARTKAQADAYNYSQIAQIADHVIVMAYDEHWRTGPAGPIASRTWCQNVAKFAGANVPAEKLVMGVPLYGRSWQTETLAKAYRFTETEALIRETGQTVTRTADGTPGFSYETKVRMKVFFEDEVSLMQKLAYYESAGVTATAFWRVGQGPVELWQKIEVTQK